MTRNALRLAEAHPDVPAVMTPQQVADLLHVPVRTVMAWRNDPNMPIRGARIGKHVRFDRAEVFEFLATMQDADRGDAA